MNSTDNGLNFTFYRFLFSKTFAAMAFSFFLIFYMWKIVEVYQSVFLAGMIPTIYLLVSLLSAVPIGYAVDRVNNSVLSMLSGIILIVGFAVFSIGFSFYIVYISTAIVTLGTTMIGDSFIALLKKLVSNEGITKATALNTISASSSQLTGVALGGISLIFLSSYAPLILLGLAAASTLLSIPIKMKKNEKPSESHTEKKGFRDVFTFYRSILGFVLFALVINGFFVSLDVYSSGLFRLYLHTSPLYYTLFDAALPASMIIGSVIANRYQNAIDKPSFIFLVTLMYAPILVTIGLSRNPLIDIAASGCIGFINPLINVPLTSRLTKFTPVEIYGRVMAFLRVFIQSATPVMATIFSFVSLFFTVPNILLAVGLIMIPFSGLGLSVVRLFYRKTVSVTQTA